jgi:hypothetical protein
MGCAVDGKCHVCGEREQVCYCDHCGHWICGPCWNQWIARGLAAIKQFLGGPKEGCCGPNV